MSETSSRPEPGTPSPERRRAAQELFQQALDRPTAERATFLDGACADDRVRAEVDELLKAFDDAEGFLAEPAPAGPGEQAGEVIDRYRLLEEIGEGGFGVVWMAEQVEPVRRRVAVKIIKLGMDTRQVVARFEAERQALALMDHPNIAKVLDGGATPAGRPYFVMELVRGLPVTEFCDQTSLDTKARLELFQRICMAVQHAHQKGVIHRDLKPSNILVTLHDGEPVPKVIDFGVAKATTQELTQRTLFTQFRQMIGTPEYMAPEQAEMSGLDVDTRADVYSLGVILYELLTGTKPFEARELLQRGYDEMLRHLREVEPQKPSTRISTLGDRLATVAQSRRIEPTRLGRMLRGELDWIAMRALEKQRQRRYPTVRALAEDLRRFLADEPVEAGPPTAAYRTLKLLRRHRTLAVTVALVVLSLIAGMIATGLALQRVTESEEQERTARQQIEAEKLEVERQADRAELVVGMLKDMLGSSNPHSRRRPDMTVRELLDEFDRDAYMLDQDPEVAATLRATVGTAYRNLGLLDKSETHLRAALDLRRNNLGPDHVLVSQSLSEWSWQQHDRGDYESAILTMQEALEITERELGPNAPWVGARLSALADYARHLGRFDEALDYSNRALDLLEQDATGAIARVAAIEIKGMTLKQLGRYDEAEKLQREIVEVLRNEYGPRHVRVAAALASLAETLMQRGQVDDAETAHREALAQREEFLGPRHQLTASSINNLAGVYELRGKWSEAEAMYRKSIAQDPGNGVGKLITHANLGMVLMRQDRWKEAEDEFEIGIHGLETALPPNHPTLAMILGNKARLMELTDRFAEAESILVRVQQMRARTLPPTHPQQAVGRGMLGMIYYARGKTEAAERALADAATTVRKAFNEPHPYVAITLNHHALTLRGLGRHTEAEPLLIEAGELFEQLDGRKSTWAEARVGLALVMLDTDRVAEAEAIVREVVDLLTERDSKSWQRWWAVGTLGEVLATKGEMTEALPMLEDAAEKMKPRRPQKREYRDRIEKRLGSLRGGE